MQLYYCPTCEKFKVHVVATLILERMRVAIREGDFEVGHIHVGNWEDKHSHPLDKVEDVTCPECKSPLVIKDVPECPHEFRRFGLQVPRRVCEFCGQEQHGRVVYDEQ